MSATLAAPGAARVDPSRLVAVACGLGVVALFSNAMTGSLSYDEDQYIAAGVLTQTMLPYRDFVYLQAPLYPFVLAAAFKLTGGYYLLTARMLTFGLALLGAGLLWRLVRRLGAGVNLAVLLLAACATSPFLAAPLSNSRNDALPLVLVLAGLAIQPGLGGRGGWWARAGAALLFGLAVEAKVSYVFAPLALGLHALLAPRTRLPPVLWGTALAALPGLACLALAPDAFRFGLWDYHVSAPFDWYAQQGMGDTLHPAAKLGSLVAWCLTGGNPALLMLAIAAAATPRARRVDPLLPLLTGGAVLMGFAPTPSWEMYYAAVPPLLACCIAGAPALRPARVQRIVPVLSALPVCAAILLALPGLARVAVPSRWVGIEAHRTAAAIRDALPSPGPVVTLFPRMVVDAVPIRPDLATGPFVFRSGGLYAPERLARLHALAPGTLAAALDASPPAGIYAGLYRTSWTHPMDAALTRYAQDRGWTVVLDGADGGRLWARPRL